MYVYDIRLYKPWITQDNSVFLTIDDFTVCRWKVIVDNLMTQDKVTFRDLLGRVGYSSAPGVINIFSSLEQVCVCMKWPSPSPTTSNPTGIG